MKTETLVSRDFLVKCKANKGGKYLVPVECVEIRQPSADPLLDYDVIGAPSESFGEIKERLLKRGHLVETKSGLRMTRAASIGKSSIRPGRNGFCFVTVRVQVREWLQFTKRTEDPKLSWLENECEKEGLRIVRQGESWHAPITYVHRDDYDKAWAILDPVDNVPDNAKRFRVK